MPPPTLEGAAAAQRVRLFSFPEYQGLIDFRPYVERLVARLERDAAYPPQLYVPQRMRFQVGEEEHTSADALESVEEWLVQAGRFTLVLGDFGTGKSFLTRRLAWRLAQPGSPLVPLLIDLRKLEKARGMDELVVQHLAAAGVERIDLPAFHYMLEHGLIALLFDGFDELALRVSYERAADHFDTLLQAARGDARVVVTSRTQHFISDAQVHTALLEKLDTVVRRRVATLEAFDRGQVHQFLVNRLGDKDEADDRQALFDEIRDLAGLAENPRMLTFISALNPDDLRAAREAQGEITAAQLYELILKQWLVHEFDRQNPAGATPSLSVEDRWRAVEEIALMLWSGTERTVGVRELSKVADAAERLAELKLDHAVAAHQIGSGTLLIRDESGNFCFLHQSILEWLVARHAARELQKGNSPVILRTQPVSALMADFLCDLAGRERTAEWARRVLAGEATAEEAKNALSILERLGEGVEQPVDLSGKNLAGEDLSGRDLTGARMVGTQLTGARLVGAKLDAADLSQANLRDADLSRASLRNAVMNNTDLIGAKLLGADLTGAALAGAILRRAKLVGATVSADALRQCDTMGAALPEHEPPIPWLEQSIDLITAVAWSADNALIVGGSIDGSVYLWEAASGREIRRIEGHGASVQSVAFSPDGTRIVSSGHDSLVRLWEATSGRELRRMEGHDASVWSVAFSPDGTWIVSGGDDTVRLWETASGRELRRMEGHGGSVRSVAFCPDGTRIVSGSNDGTARLWETASGRELRRMEGHDASVQSVAFSPDSTLIVSGNGDGTVLLWETDSGHALRRMEGHGASVQSVAFSPDSTLIISGGDDKTMRLWDTASGHELRRMEGHGTAVQNVTFSPDGTMIVSSGGDSTVRVWETTSGRELRRMGGHGPSVRSVAFSPDSTRIVSGDGDGTVRLWDIDSGRELRRMEGHDASVQSVAFSPDATMIVSGSDDGTMRLWETASGDELRRLEVDLNWVESVAFSPDGALIVSGSADETVRLWETASGHEIRRMEGHTDWIQSVAFSPDGALIVSGGDNTVRVWETASGHEIRRMEGHDTVLTVVFSPDGTLIASGSGDGTVRLWKTDSGHELRRMEGHTDWVRSVVFSNDGTLVVSGSDDSTVRLWEAASGRELRRLEGSGGWVLSIAFSPDSRMIASSVGAKIQLSDPHSGKMLFAFGALTDGSVNFTPDGRYRTSGEVNGQFWHSIGLCRFEVGELDPYLPLRLPDDEPLLTVR